MTGRQRLTGWGRTAAGTTSTVDRGRDENLVRMVRQSDPSGRGLIARGAGRAYGDAAVNSGGAVVDMTTADRILAWDGDTVTVESGLELGRLTAAALRRGLRPAVVPGTAHVTVGGAIAADVHGKNHPAAGAFTAYVTAVDLLLPDGEIRTVTRDGTPLLFRATAGGMGLTGLVLRATIRLLPVDSAHLVVRTVRCAGLDGLLGALTGDDGGHPYGVAWVDTLARGSTLGRGVVDRARHARPDELRRVSAGGPSGHLGVPVPIPFGLVTRGSAWLFNEVWFHRAPPRPRWAVRSAADFSWKLDGVGNWNRLYGPRGFVQYQFVVPFGAEDTLRLILHRLATRRLPSVLAVLKRLGAGGDGLLSFPMPGWTLAFDLPATTALVRLLDDLDELVADAGGRVYLAKDARLRPDVLTAMYPGCAEFRRLRSEIDPRGVLVSDLARRLTL